MSIFAKQTPMSTSIQPHEQGTGRKAEIESIIMDTPTSPSEAQIAMQWGWELEEEK